MRKIVVVILLIILSIFLMLFFILKNYEDPIKSKQEIISGLNELENYINKKKNDYTIENISIAIISQNELIYSKDFNKDTNEKLLAGSLSKVLSSYCALQLVENEKLSLDNPIRDYIKTAYLPDSKYDKQITLRMLLSHTSGLKNDPSGRDRNIYFVPGSKFSYSGGGFTYLQNVIEQKTGQNFGDYIDNEVLQKLGMNNSTFNLVYNGKRKVMAAASLITTPADLSKFFIEIMEPKYINKKFIDEMVKPQVHVFNYISWGLGIGLYKGNYENAIWHWGNYDNIYHSLVVIYTKSKTGIIIMIKGKNGSFVYKDIAHKAIGGDNSLFSFVYPVHLW